MPKILVTGASGFVGKSLTSALLRQGYSICAAVRSISSPNNSSEIVVGEIDRDTHWTDALRDVNVLIHLAARVHLMNDVATNPLAEFSKINVEGTLNLAQQAAKAGVKRFVYVSSIGVNGTHTVLPFTELDNPKPHNDYALSKFQAEQALHEVSAKTGLEIVIVRPPLVYGFGAPGNFAQMIKVLAKNIPLPLWSVKNSRSLIYVENLVDALILCATHPAAAGQMYLVSDGQDISTPDLLCKLSSAMGSSARLFACPLALMRLVGRLLGKSEQIGKLVGSLQVDSSKIRRELGWKPPFTLDEGLKATVSDK